MTRREEIDTLRGKIAKWDRKSREAGKRIHELELEEDRERYCCSCVRLNREIDIYDMDEQSRAGRNGLGCGFVAECLSAVKSCPHCHGSGVPS